MALICRDGSFLASDHNLVEVVVYADLVCAKARKRKFLRSPLKGCWQISPCSLIFKTRFKFSRCS
jgi:hypothetical protein